MNKFVFCSLSLIAGAAAHLGAAEISSDLQAKIANGGSSKVIITFKDKTNRGKLAFKGSTAEVRRTLNANYKASSAKVKSILSFSKTGGGEVVSELPFANALVANVSNKTLKDLANNPDIAQITLDRVIMFEETPANSNEEVGSSKDWTYGLKVLGVDKVRAAYNLTGKGVRVGILDTGIDAEHPDLKGKVVAWKDWAGDSETPKDAHGHGTHCAGTIAGGDASGKNIGVAPEVELVIGRIFGDSGGATLSGILGAMNWITDPDSNADTDDAPRIVSNSWGGRQGSMQSEKAMWNIIKTWRSLNMVPVFAAGNSGPRAKTMGTPGGYPHSFAVAATDSKDKAAYFSSRGPITWEGVDYVKPDIAAPGVDIYSAKPGGGYQKMSGTSMACPHVSGLAALVLQANPALTVKQVEKALTAYAVDLGAEGKDSTFGEGRVDIKASIDAIKGVSEKQQENFDTIYGN
ncbi:MAG: hypothetical protein COB02_18380 [Candidatus Cloacimonadota bacterium]|nr:MAG: hypothetical protein COB02_18380 [Candidatus Cloacimonadota bacterium]